MTYLAFISFVLMTATSISLLLNLSIGISVPLAILSGILWTYFFGINDNLYLGYLTLFPAFAIMFFIVIFVKRNDLNKKFLTEIASPSVVLFCLITAWTYKNSENMRFAYWDEFSHWGPTVKSMFLFDKFNPLSPALLLNTNYPPALETLSYLIVKIGGIWDESLVIWAHQILLIAIGTALIGKFRWRQPLEIFLSVSIIFLSSVFFFESFNTIYADPLLAVTFGFSAYLAASNKIYENSKFIFGFLITVAVLTLVKDAGIVLATISIVVLFFNLMISGRLEKVGFRKYLVKSLAFSFLSMSTILLIRFSWSSLLNSQSITTAESIISPGDVTAESSNIFAKPYASTVLKNIFFTLRFGSIASYQGVNISALDWILIFCLVTALLAYSSNRQNEKIRTLVTDLFIIFGFMIYIVFIFIAYLNYFSPSDAEGLTSFARYLSAYLGGVLLYFAARVVDSVREYSDFINFQKVENLDKTSISRSTAVVSFLLFLMFFAPQGHLIYYISNPNTRSDTFRDPYVPVENLITEASFGLNDNVWVIKQHSQGIEYYMYQYMILPGKVGKLPFSIGSPYGDGDIWTDQSMDATKWRDELIKFQIDYVLMAGASESFIAEFGKLFESPDTLTQIGLYKVNISEGSVSLVKVK